MILGGVRLYTSNMGVRWIGVHKYYGYVDLWV